jgi:hypothetical protein
MNILPENFVNYKSCLKVSRRFNHRKNTVLIFKFIGDRTDIAYLQTKYYPLRGLYSLQIGNIGSITDKLEYHNSHLINNIM